MKVAGYRLQVTCLKNLSRDFIVYCLLSIAYSGISSCGNSETDSSLADKNASRILDTTGGMKVMLLPSPLQIASAVKLADIKYSQKIFDKTEKATADYQVSYLKALNLGIYSIDMGYAAVYNDYSVSAKYASKIQAAMDDLGIESGVKKGTKERIQQNMNNNDTLYKIILESYRDAHEYFKSNEREDVGLMILTGAFIEGLYISSSLAKENNSIELMRLIGMQKIFLQNINELLNKYADQKDIKSILAKMDVLNKTFSAIDLHYDSASDKLTGGSISSEQLNQICLNTSAIRNEIIN